MENRGPQLAGTCASLLALAIVAVSVRCYVRLTLTKSFGYDDWLILATLVFYALFCVVVLIGVHHGTGQHRVNLASHDFSIAMKMWWLCEIFYSLSSTFTRLAAGALLLRLTINPVHVRVVWFIMTFASLFGIAFLVQILVQCQPTKFFWSVTRDPSEGHCINLKINEGFTYAHAVVASTSDWTFGILPAFIISGLKMNLRTKASVFLLLCLANIGSIATLIRFKAIHEITRSEDFLFATVDLALWSSVEVGVAIIAASIATFRPLFRSFFSSGNSSNASYGTATHVRPYRGSTHHGHSPHEDHGLQETKREHKTTISETSTSEIFGMAELPKEV